MKVKVCVWDGEPQEHIVNIDEVKEVPVGTELRLEETLRSLPIYVFSKKADLCPPFTFHQHTHVRYKADKHVTLKEISSYGGYGSLSAGARYEFKLYDADPLSPDAEVIAEGKWSYDYSVFGGGSSLVTLKFIKPCLVIIRRVLYIVK